MSSDDEDEAFEQFKKEQKRNVRKRYMSSRELAQLDTMDDFIADSSSESCETSKDESDNSKTSDDDVIDVENFVEKENQDLADSNIKNESSISLFSSLSDSDSDSHDTKFKKPILRGRKRIISSDDDLSDISVETNKKTYNNFSFKTPKKFEGVSEIKNTSNYSSLLHNTSSQVILSKTCIKVDRKVLFYDNLNFVTPNNKLKNNTKTIQSKTMRFKKQVSDNEVDGDSWINSESDSDAIFSESDESQPPVPSSAFYTPITKLKIIQSDLSKTAPAKQCLKKFDFISSLLNDVKEDAKDCDAANYIKRYKSLKAELSLRIYQICNQKVFSNKLPQDIDIRWYPRLRKTAGRCILSCDKENPLVHIINIDLSTKVLTDAERLLRTLVHEMCHGAVWVINKINDHHGPLWKAWTYEVHRAFPLLSVSSRCHSYEIEYKYEYICGTCSTVIKRHTNSLDIQKEVCGDCHGILTLFINQSNGKRKEVQESSKQQLTGFSKFVKENYKKFRSTGISHVEVMKILSDKYKLSKEENDLGDMFAAVTLQEDN